MFGFWLSILPPKGVTAIAGQPVRRPFRWSRRQLTRASLFSCEKS